MDLRLTIICRGVQNRVNRGEDLEAVLDTYSKLTAAEKDLIRETIKV